MLYILKEFKHLLVWWMGIWMHTHTITITNADPDLGKLADVLGEVCVQLMPLCYGWGRITFQSATHIHVIHIKGFWSASVVVDGYMDAHSHHYHHQCSPRFGRVEWSPRWIMCTNDATILWLRLCNLSNCIPHPCYSYWRCLCTFWCGGWAYGCKLKPLQPQIQM